METCLLPVLFQPGTLCPPKTHHGRRPDRDQLQLLHSRMGGVDVPQGEHQEPEKTHPQQHDCKHLNGFDLFGGASATGKCC